MEREVELVAIAGHQLKSFLLLRNACHFIELMKFVLVVLSLLALGDGCVIVN